MCVLGWFLLHTLGTGLHFYPNNMGGPHHNGNHHLPCVHWAWLDGVPSDWILSTAAAPPGLLWKMLCLSEVRYQLAERKSTSLWRKACTGVLQILLVLLYIYYMHRLKSAKVTDKRVRIMNEIISGIRVVKMYAWDYAFKKLIKKLRRCASCMSIIIGILGSFICTNVHECHAEHAAVCYIFYFCLIGRSPFWY